MKKLRAIIHRYFNRLDRNWQSLTIGKQRQYLLYFFTIYVVLTASVVFKVCYDTTTSKNELLMEYIQHPIPKSPIKAASLQDTLQIILKKLEP